MVTITLAHAHTDERLAVDVGFVFKPCCLDHEGHAAVMAWVAANRPGARVLGYQVFPENQRQEWEEMAAFLAARAA